jgi:hypothetical protein
VLKAAIFFYLILIAYCKWSLYKDKKIKIEVWKDDSAINKDTINNITGDIDDKIDFSIVNLNSITVISVGLGAVTAFCLHSSIARLIVIEIYYNQPVDLHLQNLS